MHRLLPKWSHLLRGACAISESASRDGLVRMPPFARIRANVDAEFKAMFGSWMKRLFCSERRIPISQDLMAVMERRMISLEGRHAYLTQALSKPAASPDEIATINKELSKMEDCIHTIAALRAKREEMKGLKSILDDAVEDEEMHKLAIDEFRLASSDELELQHQVLFMMLPRDEADRRGCILEVRAGTGGEEASLFAMDIFKMYERFAQKQSWRFEVLDVTETDLRGYKEASASITGDGVYGKLKFESGVHRVQVSNVFRLPTMKSIHFAVSKFVRD